MDTHQVSTHRNEQKKPVQELEYPALVPSKLVQNDSPVRELSSVSPQQGYAAHFQPQLTEEEKKKLTEALLNEQLRNITFWSLGSLGGASWTAVLAILPFTGIALVGIPRLAKSLNLLALGESQATMLGVNLKAIKRLVIIFSTMAARLK